LINDNDMVLTVKDVMAILHVGRITVYKLIENRQLKAAKIAGKYRTTRAAIYEYLQKAMTAEFRHNQPACYNQPDCVYVERQIPSAERSGYLNSAERNRT
jgi:excisionase family DNA binding protein